MAGSRSSSDSPLPLKTVPGPIAWPPATSTGVANGARKSAVPWLVGALRDGKHAWICRVAVLDQTAATAQRHDGYVALTVEIEDAAIHDQAAAA